MFRGRWNSSDKMAGLWHPADHRLRNSRSISATRIQTARKRAGGRRLRAIVLAWQRERGEARLIAGLMRLKLPLPFLETPVHQAPRTSRFEWLEGDAEDLIALTGGPDGPISLAIAADQAALAAIALRPAGWPVR